jgi:hypothetical protein
MAKVPLSPIGSSRDAFLDAGTFAEEPRRDASQKDSDLAAKRAKVAAGWGATYLERVHQKGKLSARERVEALKDPGSPVREVGTFVNHGRLFGKLESPAAGVVTAFVSVENRWTIVIANDNTVASGSWWPKTPEKIERAQEMALRLRLPVVYLVDCSGLYLPEQSASFPGLTGAGHIFKKNAELSHAGVPQIAGVFGDCIAGGGYMPIISDRVYMTESAYMVIAGAALIKGAKSMHLSSLDIGGPEVHVHQSGCADVRVPDDKTALAMIRAEIARLAQLGRGLPPPRRGSRRRRTIPRASSKGIFPTDYRMTVRGRGSARAPRRPLAVLGDLRRSRPRDDGRRRTRRRFVHGLRRESPGRRRRSRAPGAKKPAGFSTRKASRRSRRSAARATPTGFRSCGCRTSRASTSASKRSGWACSVTVEP